MTISEATTQGKNDFNYSLANLSDEELYNLSELWNFADRETIKKYKITRAEIIDFLSY